MNYIKHLTNWFELLKSNEEVKPSHIAMYIVLFQLWNQSRFLTTFIINRSDLMNLCKIGSKTMYSNCMSDMHRWGWINYKPSFSKYGSSTVTMQDWSNSTVNSAHKNTSNKRDLETATTTTTETAGATAWDTTTETGRRQDMGHNNKTYKQQKENNKNSTYLKKNYHEPM